MIRVTFLTVVLVAGICRAESPSVVVLSAKTKPPELGTAVTQLVADALAAEGHLRIRDAADLAAAGDAALRKQLEACDDDTACLVDVGGAVGAKYFAIPALAAIGTTSLLSLRVLASKDGSVVARVSMQLPRKDEAVVDAVCLLVQELLDQVTKAEGSVQGDRSRCERPLPPWSPGARDPLLQAKVESPTPSPLKLAVGARLDVNFVGALARDQSFASALGLQVIFGDHWQGAVSVLFPLVALRLEGRHPIGDGPVRVVPALGGVVYRDAFGVRAGAGIEWRLGVVRLLADAGFEGVIASWGATAGKYSDVAMLAGIGFGWEL